MSDKKLKVVVIDNDSERKNTIKSILPSYTETFVYDFGGDAQKALKMDATGRIPSLVIMNADDENGKSLEIFEYIRIKEPSLCNRYIPVILLTEDEFSDRCVDFLEIGDVFFYEGEILEDTFFSAFVEAIESRDFYVQEEIESALEDSRPAEHLLGKNIKAPKTEPGQTVRSMVVNPETQLAQLEMALERGRKRVEQIKRIFDEAQKENAKRQSASGQNAVASSNASYANDNEGAAREQNAPNQNIQSQGSRKQSYGYQNNSATSGNVIPSNSLIYGISQFGQEFANSYANSQFKTSASEFYKMYESRVRGNVQTPTPYDDVKISGKKGRMVVVDDDLRVLKAFEMFMGQDYDVVTFPSGMKAVDYFIAKTADIIFMDVELAGLSGSKTLNSIRWQPRGKNVPAIYMVEKDYSGDKSELTGHMVFGVMHKPIIKNNIIRIMSQMEPYINKAPRY